MYGPLASNFGTAGLRQSLGGILNSVRKLTESNYFGSEGIDLLEQINDLLDVTISLNELATKHRRNLASIRIIPGSVSLHLESLGGNVAAVAQECLEYSGTLQSSLTDIIHQRGATSETQLSEQVWYDEIHQTLKFQTETLRILLSAINLVDRKDDVYEDGNLLELAHSSASTLQYQIAVLKSKFDSANGQYTATIQSAIKAAEAVSFSIPTSLNKHFLVGRSVKSFYTGRDKQMSLLNAAFEQSKPSGQKRFIIYGLGGSGKTELALKYAENHIQDFWGVFLVDGSSRKNAFGSYAEIAKIGGVEPNEKAAKNWLTTRALPWLLIIDNVDDDEVRLEELLPAGKKGHILVTSRNPAHKSYGTVGERYIELLPMEKEEADELLLKAAEEPTPWTIAVKDSASLICRALGFLPLALVHAGKAIMLGLCSWSGYLTFYDNQTQRIRRERFHQRDRSLSRSRNRVQEDKESMNVFSSYEILYQSLETSEEQSFQDAVELLRVFSYHHFQNIRLDEFIHAATNPLKEAKAREEEAKEDEELLRKLSTLRQKTWSGWLRELAFRLLQSPNTPQPLPDALKNPHNLSATVFEEEVQLRVRTALVVLVSRSLIMKQDRLEDRYSMHPLIHKWVRERPKMSTSQQALWCQVAMTTLARSILLPPLGDTEKERSMRRELLPHIIHIRGCQEVIKERLKENQSLRKSVMPLTKPKFGSLQAIEAARFSLVYSECGIFNDALELQIQVRDFLNRMFGEEHPLSIRITLFLVGTLWELSRTKEATELQ